MGINFNQLAEETMELTKQFSLFPAQAEEDSIPTVRPEKTLIEVTKAHGLIEDASLVTLPQVSGAGIIFYFDGGISTFCLRGVLSEDLEADFDSFKRKDPKFLDQFRLKPDWIESNFNFYSCSDIYQAQVIVDEVLNKRFPKDEAIVCNISDPGFSWWLDLEDDGFQIYYQGQTIERDVNSLQLGPLGDQQIAMRRFSASMPYLKKFFPINEFSSSEKSFQLSCSQAENHSFAMFRDLFLKGEWKFDYLIDHSRGDERTFFLYLKEIANLRSFWIFVRENFISSDRLLQ